MPASVTLHQLCYSTPANQQLFSQLDLSFGPGRTGLIGRNGTGKSTLLRIIAGDLAPSTGSASVNGSIGMLQQSVGVAADQTIGAYLGVAEELARLARLEAGLGSIDDATGADWTLPGRITQALQAVGLPDYVPGRLLGALSGGQGTRLALARLMLEAPDIILLDEPTNNLDAEGRAAVATLLRNWRGTAIVVSHDRALLGEMDAIVELTTLGARSYGGNWDHYTERKALELASAEHALVSAERKIVQIDNKLQAQADKQARKDGAGKRKAEKGGVPKIVLGGMKENAENTSAAGARLANRLRGEAAQAVGAARGKIEILTPLSVKLTPTRLPVGRTVLEATGLTGGPLPEAPIIDGLSFKLTGPERVAVIGPNGSGKTTLLRLLTSALAPQAGSVRLHVRHALLDQTVSLLNPALSIRDNFRQLNPDADENTGRSALARFMFRADAALQMVGTLSGGETLRAGLACTIGGDHPPQLLILDEPTNHLDIEAVEQLEAGLRGYDGALLVVSHDAVFLSAIGIRREISLPIAK